MIAVISIFCNLFLLGCNVSSSIHDKAEKSVLVCYDNGTLVYASETSIDEMSHLLQQQKDCVEKRDTERKSFYALKNQVCPVNIGSGLDLKEELDIFQKQNDCAEKHGIVDTKIVCDMRIIPIIRDRHTRFVDKGTIFESYTLNCISRIPKNLD